MYLPNISVLWSQKSPPVDKGRQKWLENTSAANELLYNLAPGIYQLPFKRQLLLSAYRAALCYFLFWVLLSRTIWFQNSFCLLNHASSAVKQFCYPLRSVTAVLEALLLANFQGSKFTFISPESEALTALKQALDQTGIVKGLLSSSHVMCLYGRRGEIEMFLS